MNEPQSHRGHREEEIREKAGENVRKEVRVRRMIVLQSHRGEKSGGKSLYSGDGDPRVRGDDGVDRTEAVCLVPTVLRGNKKVCEAELWGTSAFPNEISERGRKEGKERLTLPPSFARKR